MPPLRRRLPLALLYWGLALVIAGWMLYLALRGVEWTRVWRIVSSADLRLVGLSFLIGSGACFVRGLRWRILLTADRPIGAWPVFCANMVGYLGNSFLPARAGELLRSGMISARTGIPAARALTTALAERLVDAVVLVSWTTVILLTMRHKPEWMARAAMPAALVAFVGALTLILAPFAGPFLARLARRLPVPRALQDRFVRILADVLDGIRSLHDRRRLAGFLALTCVIWTLDTVSCIVLGRALGMSLSIPAALLLIAGLGLGSALPSTPGYVGIYQFVAVTVLAPFGFSNGDAIAYILVSQALGYVVVTIWGSIGLWEYRRPQPVVGHHPTTG